MAACTRCKRPLKDPDSIQRGFGPVCWARKQAETEIEAETQNQQEYCGPYDGGDIVLKLLPDWTMYANVPHVIVKHSPTGFAWGYGGSGPADLALNILYAVTKNKRVAENYYQQFKWDFIANMPPEGGVIKREEILSWLKEQELRTAEAGA